MIDSRRRRSLALRSGKSLATLPRAASLLINLLGCFDLCCGTGDHSPMSMETDHHRPWRPITTATGDRSPPPLKTYHHRQLETHHHRHLRPIPTTTGDRSPPPPKGSPTAFKAIRWKADAIAVPPLVLLPQLLFFLVEYLLSWTGFSPIS